MNQLIYLEVSQYVFMSDYAVGASPLSRLVCINGVLTLTLSVVHIHYFSTSYRDRFADDFYGGALSDIATVFPSCGIRYQAGFLVP